MFLNWKIFKPVAVALIALIMLSGGIQQASAAPRTSSTVARTTVARSVVAKFITSKKSLAAADLIDCSPVPYDPCSPVFLSGMGNPINGWWYSVNGFGCCNLNYGQGGVENWQYTQSGGWSDRLQWATQNYLNGYVWENATIDIWIGTEDATSCDYGWVQDVTGTKTTFWLPEGSNSGWHRIQGPVGGAFYTNTYGGGVFVSLTNQADPSKCGSGNGGNLVAGSKIQYQLYGHPNGV